MRHLAALMCVLLLLGVGSAQQTNSELLPQTASDWKVEVMASAPKVLHPTTIACTPDGRVLVCEDYMDMRGPVDSDSNRILCFHPDGRVTVYADKMFAVFGIEYLDGNVFVHHTPRFTVFKDGGDVGLDRQDLIHTTNPAPWGSAVRGKNQINDHVPAGFRLAMDGFFYMAFGDKGLRGMIGRDGRHIEIPIGGVLRMRPDATEMEIFATGFRTVLNPMLTDEDDIFLYDNDDHKAVYQVAVGHVIDGGYYGYPWDHRPPLPGYVLKMDVRRYPGGAPTASLIYDDDALPEKYQGNLFLCDWGRQELVRLCIERDGATFHVTEEETLLKDNFRPTGIAAAPDGKTFYVGDWQHHSWRDETAKVGRVLKLTYIGPVSPTRKPNWYLAVAMGQDVQQTTESLIDALSHPARNVRMLAQRLLASRREGSVQRLIEVLGNDSQPVHARWHALWTLDAIDGGRSARQFILDCLNDRKQSVRVQAMRQLGTRRVDMAAEPLCSASESASSLERFHAVTALGRIAIAQSIATLQRRLADEDRFVRYAAFVALNRIGRAHPESWSEIATGLLSPNEQVRMGTQFALRETYDPMLVSTLLDVASSTVASLASRISAHASLLELRRMPAEWDGLWWRLGPLGHYEDIVDARPKLPNTRDWPETTRITQALHDAMAGPNLDIRLTAVEHLTIYPDKTMSDVLNRQFEVAANAREQVAILRALAASTEVNSPTAVLRTIEVPHHEPDVLLAAIAATRVAYGHEIREPLERLVAATVQNDVLCAALRALAQFQSPASSSAIVPLLSNQSPQVRSAAASALGLTGGAEAKTALRAKIDDANVEVRRQVISSLGQLRVTSSVPELLLAYETKETRFEAALALATMPDIRALGVYLDGVGIANRRLRLACADALKAIADKSLDVLLDESTRPALTNQAVRELQQIFRDDQRAAALFKNLAPRLTAEDYAAYATGNVGVAEAGKALFHDAKGLNCIACHTVGTSRGIGGPDLTHIASKYKRNELTESVLYPSKKLLPEFRLTVIVTVDGEVISGLVTNETPDMVSLIDSNGRQIELLKPEVEEQRVSDQSPMPNGIQTSLTVQEFSDLVTYLESLK